MRRNRSTRKRSTYGWIKLLGFGISLPILPILPILPTEFTTELDSYYRKPVHSANGAEQPWRWAGEKCVALLG